MSTTNFFFKDGEITNFTADYFTSAFRNANYKILKLEVDASIIQRMENVNLSYIFNFKIQKDGKTFIVEDFDEHCDISVIDEEFQSEFKQMLDDWKAAAVKNKSQIVVENTNLNDSKNIENPKDLCDLNTKREITVKEDVYNNHFFVKVSKTPNVLELMFGEQFINLWGGCTKSEDLYVINGNLLFKNIGFDAMKACVEFKLKDWKRFCVANVTLKHNQNFTVVYFDVENSDLNNDSAMRSLWVELVFHRIAPIFNLALL